MVVSQMTSTPHYHHHSTQNLKAFTGALEAMLFLIMLFKENKVKENEIKFQV